MGADLSTILAVLTPAAAAAGAWGGVRYYFGKLEATDLAHSQRLNDHDERIKFLERHPSLVKR